MLAAPFLMAPGTAAIRLDYPNHVTLDEVAINGFYDGVFADNAFNLRVWHSVITGGRHSNLWQQHSEVSHGPDFGGPLSVENSNLESCECSAPSIWVQDVAVVEVTDTDIVGVSRG